MDRTETCTVTSSHVLVERFHSIGSGHLTEFLVHVVGTRARVVSDPDTEVLDLQGMLLVDLEKRKNQQMSLIILAQMQI